MQESGTGVDQAIAVTHPLHVEDDVLAGIQATWTTLQQAEITVSEKRLQFLSAIVDARARCADLTSFTSLCSTYLPDISDQSTAWQNLYMLGTMVNSLCHRVGRQEVFKALASDAAEEFCSKALKPSSFTRIAVEYRHVLAVAAKEQIKSSSAIDPDVEGVLQVFSKFKPPAVVPQPRGPRRRRVMQSHPFGTFASDLSGTILGVVVDHVPGNYVLGNLSGKLFTDQVQVSLPEDAVSVAGPLLSEIEKFEEQLCFTEFVGLRLPDKSVRLVQKIAGEKNPSWYADVVRGDQAYTWMDARDPQWSSPLVLDFGSKEPDGKKIIGTAYVLREIDSPVIVALGKACFRDKRVTKICDVEILDKESSFARSYVVMDRPDSMWWNNSVVVVWPTRDTKYCAVRKVEGGQQFVALDNHHGRFVINDCASTLLFVAQPQYARVDSLFKGVAVHPEFVAWSVVKKHRLCNHYFLLDYHHCSWEQVPNAVLTYTTAHCACLYLLCKKSGGLPSLPRTWTWVQQPILKLSAGAAALAFFSDAEDVCCCMAYNNTVDVTTLPLRPILQVPMQGSEKGSILLALARYYRDMCLLARPDDSREKYTCSHRA